ncbi:hypothetical protein HF521_005401 [Silurus meridionalis]|uniref:Helicase C-terminal domain-containing protein n=1 Tax=Silurus meridionalis TaxID=175797 RepID=A0A8T0AXJ8_SILME|nr:hypothetical protein HF521_005401 [Silurus meridionalis]
MSKDSEVQSEIVVKRSCSNKKRNRDGMKSDLTPAKKRLSAEHCKTTEHRNLMKIKREEDPVTEQCCSDSEDLFDGYDSIIADSSFLAKLEDIEQVTPQTTTSTADHLADFTDGFHDASLRDLPSSQLAFQQVVQNQLHLTHTDRPGNTSTPDKKHSMQSVCEDQYKPARRARRSMADQLKRAMKENAASSNTVSKTVLQKQAAVSEEISVAVQTIESVTSEGDLGPFFGLPSKVKDLIMRLKRIEDLYEWQKACLNLDSVHHRKNLIYSLPTSGGRQSTQIIGMSATLGNVADLLNFLGAENYTNDFRPVQLNEYVKLKDSIYEVDPKEEQCFRFSRLLTFKYSSGMQKLDPDHIIALVTEVIPQQSCLIFCATKKNCENVAGMICKYLNKEFLKHREEGKTTLLSELRKSGNGSLCPVLQKTVPYGLAYHHSGLTSDERKLLEEAYSSGVLCLLACTSTLAAGINLPARRVILRSPYVGTDFLKRSQYKQMVGRAGRAGIDSMGESILILQDKDRDRAKQLVCAPIENCYSNLLQDGSCSLQSLILSLIGLNITSTVEQVLEFISRTLLSVQETRLCQQKSLRELVVESVDILKEKGLIGISPHEQSLLNVTKLGRATYKGSVDLRYSDVLYKDLSKGLEGLLLNSFLHLVYLVTPYDLLSQIKPDWMIYFSQLTKLSVAEQKMAAAIGVPESFLVRKAAGQSVRKSVDSAVVNRLYLALVLYSLLNETNIWNVSDRFQLARGLIQTLVSSASAFCSCVLHFTEELEEFWAYKALLTELTRRLTYCVQAELIPLMEVAGVMEFRAKQLYNAGYKTLAHLANADPSMLVKTVENLNKRQANLIVASAKMLLQEKAEALQEEVDELLMFPADLPESVYNAI